MRHFFLPACLCLMALPGTTGNATLPRLDRVAAAPAMDGLSAEPARDGGITTRDKSESTDIPIDSDTGFDAASRPRRRKVPARAAAVAATAAPRGRPLARRDLRHAHQGSAYERRAGRRSSSICCFRRAASSPASSRPPAREGIAQFMPETVRARRPRQSVRPGCRRSPRRRGCCANWYSNSVISGWRLPPTMPGRSASRIGWKRRASCRRRRRATSRPSPAARRRRGSSPPTAARR